MKTAGFVLVALLLATVAEAGVEVRSFTVTSMPDGTYSYGFRLKLVSGRLDPGSPVPQIVTIYDVPGVIPGSLFVSAPWGGILQFTGVDANDIPRSASDNPAIQNITLKYTGATVITAPAEVGQFSFRVPAGPSGPLVYIGQSTSPYLGAVGLIGRISGPAGK
ncbi:MAG TPA: hypothetical protein VGD79_05895 [Thermoanaerobaculia bacterium]|jgi:hypothetical protein